MDPYNIALGVGSWNAAEYDICIYVFGGKIYPIS